MKTELAWAPVVQITCSRLLLNSGLGGTRARDLWVTIPRPYHIATEPRKKTLIIMWMSQDPWEVTFFLHDAVYLWAIVPFTCWSVYDAVYLYLLTVNQTSTEEGYKDGRLIRNQTVGQRFTGRLWCLIHVHFCRWNSDLFLFFFYRAMPHRALPWDYVVCPSVCLSVMVLYVFAQFGISYFENNFSAK